MLSCHKEWERNRTPLHYKTYNSFFRKNIPLFQIL